MSKKTCEDHLLSSGVPLEYSVISIFEELGIRDPGEYRYERKTESGLPQVFSVDVHAVKVDPRRDLHIECLVECKYRHDGTNWVFMPMEYASDEAATLLNSSSQWTNVVSIDDWTGAF